MKIYLDMFFLVNWGMNFVVLMIESFFQSRRIRLWHILSAAAAGAVLSTVFLISGLHRYWFLGLPFYALGSAGIVRLAFGRTTPGAYVRNMVVFYLSAFLLAGLLVQLQSVLGIQGESVLLLAGAGTALVLVYRLVPFGRRWQERERQYFPICLSYGGRRMQGNGLMDTGNHLTEPFSHRPVAIGGKEFVRKLLDAGDTPVFRYIPYHSVGTESGMLPAFQAEALDVKEGGKWRRQEKPWIAISDSYVSADGEYELILHPDMLIKYE
ncbi:MAG: sigma-E processing peptidase SpoIIGA [Lachnospiraceae bacterium]|nr:sigma-E processing peptidase SpoIIGA [Lachnospiraceae bacterium]